ncbi:rod shape-determining protein [Selenomonas sp. TAMA-11512]|uniref:rod shape-determining protein n=1 Tax=Selenomonas sp. TAMA-11512 TaxID=3095337 RepID=UPI003086A351|nr:rod shape-determining protein [Selenomonas sp. TAMA-11512]
MFGMSNDIGIDLGTANVLVYVKGRGIVLNEPSVVAINRDNGTVLAIGEEARRMIGRTPGNIVAIRPLRAGVIADYEVTERMIRYFIEKVTGKRFMFRPRIMICIPSSVTTVEQRAVQEATEQAGARYTELIEEPLAAALGAGLNIEEPFGSMIVDIGGGTTDVAVISLGGIVNSESLRIAGDTFDEDIIAYVKRKYNVMIGERTAEEIKKTIGAAYPKARSAQMNIKGRDLLTGLPKNLEIDSAEIADAIGDSVAGVIHCIKKVLEETPPELAADIMERGIVMTGGGALLYGLPELVRHETGIVAALADDPTDCVAIGTGKALDYIGKFSDKAKRDASR